MILPVQITSKNVELTKDIEEDIIARARKLETYYKRITSCRVLVDAPGRHHQKGHSFDVRIDLTVPDGEIVVNRAPTLYPRERDIAQERQTKQGEIHAERKHLKVAIHDAFDAARRLLQDYARHRRADVKTHEPAPEGRVTKLFPAEDYGFVETPDGREIYFHANAVINARFKSLRPGALVTFAEEPGEKGPQASTVRVLKKARIKPMPPRPRP